MRPRNRRLTNRPETAILPSTFIGVDFSGARQAGRHIWLTEGQAVVTAGGQRTLRIGRSEPATALPGGDASRDQALRALRNHIIGAGDELPSAYGIDVPFTLPRRFLGDQSWEEFVLSFRRRFTTANHFRAWCRELEGGRERKRPTEESAHVPFAAYNLRLYRQTYYGLRDLLAPLLQAEAVWVLPIQRPDLTRPWLMETCPASALKRLGLYVSYKGKASSHRRNRKGILTALLARGELTLSDRARVNVIVDNPEGDALDSLIAAAIAFWHAPDPIPASIVDRGEGYVYT